MFLHYWCGSLLVRNKWRGTIYRVSCLLDVVDAFICYIFLSSLARFDRFRHIFSFLRVIVSHFCFWTIDYNNPSNQVQHQLSNDFRLNFVSQIRVCPLEKCSTYPYPLQNVLLVQVLLYKISCFIFKGRSKLPRKEQTTKYRWVKFCLEEQDFFLVVMITLTAPFTCSPITWWSHTPLSYFHQ